MTCITIILSAFLGAFAGAGAAFAIASHRRRMRSQQIEHLCEYLEDASIGNAPVLSLSTEDDISKLQDEICKTVSALERSRTRAIKTKDNYATNLSNIAHQLKTPLAAISLAVQRLKATGVGEQKALADRIELQIERLQILQTNLLLLARIDAGVIEMHPKELDTLSLLCVAAESLEDIANDAGVNISVQNGGVVKVAADEHWMHEILSNVLKNCIEHSPCGGTVRAEYERNPLYVIIRISDEGPGLASGDSERIFQRFYKGAYQASGSTGLGLAFARELLELQNGTIRAYNLPERGASFDICIYSHPTVTLAS